MPNCPGFSDSGIFVLDNMRPMTIMGILKGHFNLVLAVRLPVGCDSLRSSPVGEPSRMCCAQELFRWAKGVIFHHSGTFISS